MQSRAERERNFYNRAYSGGARPSDCFYSVSGRAVRFYEALIASEGGIGSALELGCGTGGHALVLAKLGARVTGIDISDNAIELARERAREEGLDDCADFRVMDAEDLQFADTAFDLTYGAAVLHHLDLKSAYAEIARTLRPHGKAIFLEPMGHNPLINLYRRMTSGQRTEDEHPLLMHDFELARTFFATVDTDFFHLTSLLAVPLQRRSRFEVVLAALDRADAALFRTVPYFRRYAWIVILRLAGPKM